MGSSFVRARIRVVVGAVAMRAAPTVVTSASMQNYAQLEGKRFDLSGYPAPNRTTLRFAPSTPAVALQQSTTEAAVLTTKP